jgi:CubicO group peptidase (beta-lactamase class C family)
MMKQKMKHILIPVLLVAGGLLGAQPPKANPAGSGMDPQLLARIPGLTQSFVDDSQVAGVVTLVERHGKIASLEAVGFQNLESRKPMRTDTIFEIASMTKAVTAVLAMMLVEEGKLSLDDPVEKHLPEFRGLWLLDGVRTPNARTLKRPSRKITVRDLLTHTSGMEGNPPEGIKELIIPEMRCHLSLAEAVLVYSQLPLEFEPGSRFSYSNPGIAVVGRIIEVIAGKPYEKFLEERIFRPLGMKDSFIFPPENKKARIASLYDMVDGKLKDMGEMIYRKGARYSVPEGGIYSTAEDIVKVFRMMLNGGTYGDRRYLSKASVELMTRNHVGDFRVHGSMDKGWGLGWTVIRSEPSQSYGHTGAFGTKGWADPKKDMITLFFVQRYGGNRTDRLGEAFRAAAVKAISN